MKKTLDQIIGWVLAILMGIMTLDVLWGVFTRYVMDHQSPWSEEVARYLLIWIGILGAAYAAGQKLHLAIDLLPTKLKGKQKHWLDIVINTLIVLFSVSVLLIGGVRYVFITFKLGQTSPALQIPMGYVYLVIPLAGLLVILYKLNDIRKLWKEVRRGVS